MAQTKRKRRTKHRGTAAGSVTTRGRTSKPVSAKVTKETGKQATREAKLLKKPTWQSASIRAALFGVVIIGFVAISFKGNKAAEIPLAVVIVALYVPLGYYLDLFMWRRRMAKRGLPTR